MMHCGAPELRNIDHHAFSFDHLVGAGEQRGRHGETNTRSSDRMNERRKLYWSFWMDSTRCLECESVRTFV